MQKRNALHAPRRTVLRGAALAGLGVTAAAACSDSDDGGDSGVPSEKVELGSAGEVPVGGAKLYPDEKLVVSQPAKDEFKAFSAVCTHEGCVLSQIERKEGICTCHGSRFDVTSGEVLKGPARKPLPKVPVRSVDGKLTAGPAD